MNIIIKNTKGGAYIDLLDIIVKLSNNDVKLNLYILYDYILNDNILDFIKNKYNIKLNNIKIIYVRADKLQYINFNNKMALTTFDIFYNYPFKLFKKLFLLATNIVINDNNNLNFLYSNSYEYLLKKIKLYNINLNKIFIYNENKDFYYISNYIKKINLSDLKINNRFLNNYYINLSNINITQKDFENNILNLINNDKLLVQTKSYKLDFLNNYKNIEILDKFIPNIIDKYNKLIYWADKEVRDNTCRNIIESKLLNKDIIYLNIYNNKDGAYYRYQDIINNDYNYIKNKYELTMQDKLIGDLIDYD
jgi:hypothetical protein